MERFEIIRLIGCALAFGVSFTTAQSLGATDVAASRLSLSVNSGISPRLPSASPGGTVNAATASAHSVALPLVSLETQAAPQAPQAPTNLRILGGGSTTVGVTGGSPQSTAVNSAFGAPLRATVRDGAANPMAGVSVTFTAPASGASARFGGAATVNATTDAAGVATSPVPTANGTAGSYLVTAAVAGLTATFNLTNTASTGSPGTWVNITPPQLPSLAGCRDPQDGTQTVGLSPANPQIIYVGTCYYGIFKSTNGGSTWTKINTGANGAELDTGRNWTLAVDPTDPNVVYTVAGYGRGQGIWKSVNGGVDWTQMLTGSALSQTTADVYSITIDPLNHLHLLVGSHSGWNFTSNAGILESLNGGQTWILRPPQGSWGSGHYVFFLGQTDTGQPSSSTWILATQSNGFWRTTDSGQTWARVSTENMQHGAGQLYRASNGVLYMGALRRLLRSADNGRTWTTVGPSTSDGYNAVVGDGTYLYIQPANTGQASSPNPYYYSLESDGTVWQPYNGQTFLDGPMAMVFDQQNRVIYLELVRGIVEARDWPLSV